ncbi:anti-sigma factor [Kitasatospora paranensis]|uniref:Regulator of SigK n=1 Tax=Kitasatospora paranensis TaxID=258053 RepID=A0ABW2G269_9ACTN
MTDPADVHALSGAYAAHALTEPERAAFERHLALCATCRLEVAGFRAALARLGCAEAADPPAGAEERAMAAVTRIRPFPPARPAGPGPEPRPGRFARALRRPGRLVLAACLALAVVSGAVAVRQYDRAQHARTESVRLHTELSEFAALLTAPDVRTATTRAAGGTGTGTAVWSASRDRAAFLATDLPALPAGKAYELWLDDGGAARPAGLLHGPDGSLILDAPVHGARGIGLTLEPAAGSPIPTTDPILLLPLA